jgi:hypothetical protein
VCANEAAGHLDENRDFGRRRKTNMENSKTIEFTLHDDWSGAFDKGNVRMILNWFEQLILARAQQPVGKIEHE